MDDLTIVALCHALANITHNRCHLVENSNTCRCIDDIMGPKPTAVVSAAPDIMFSEVMLIFFVLALWLSAIGFCLNQYKSLRRLETQVHYCMNRKDPLNIGNIKIVEREQDSIIYKKKRYSTVLDTHIDHDELKAMSYVKEYLPSNSSSISATIAALGVNRDDLLANMPLSPTSMYNSSGPLTAPIYMPLSTHNEVAEEQQSPSVSLSPLASFVLLETNPGKSNSRMSYVHRTGSGLLSTGLAVPHISSPSSLRSSWNGSQIYGTSYSTQLLSVPSNSLRSNRYSDGNISLPVPQSPPKTFENPNEQLLDPRLIPKTVRRSLLALHRQSQEIIPVHRTKEKTQSENDVHGAFTPWKIKMKSKLKRTHHHPQQQQQPQARPHSKTLSILPIRQNSNDHERRISEYVTMNNEYRLSSPPPRNYSLSITPTFRRSLKHYPKYSTQSTSESETTQNDLPTITSIYLSTDNAADDDDETKTIIETSVELP